MPYQKNRIGLYPNEKKTEFLKESFGDAPVYLHSLHDSEQCRNLYCRRIDNMDWSVEYVLEGEFHYADEDEQFSLGPGDLYLLKPTGVTLLRCVSERAQKVCFIFSGTMLLTLLENMKIGRVGNRHFHFQDMTKLHNLTREARAIMSENTEKHRQQAIVFAMRMLLMISALSSPENLSVPLLKILEYLNSKQYCRVPLAELAAVGHISEVTVIRHFLTYLHTTPGEYIKKKRMDFAAELLQQPGISVKEVAHKLGYSSPQYFATDFRRSRQMSPREFQLMRSQKEGEN